MEDTNYKFQKLTPIKDIDLGIYEKAINFIFNNNDLKNIAITGQYGAGKSSLLESYKEKYNNKKFIHISLAHFTLNKQNNTTETNVENYNKQQDKSIEVNESTLEGKILNQLIHQIPAKNIPQTNFKVKRKVSPRDVLGNTLVSMLFIISLLHILFFEKWEKYVLSLSDNYTKQVLELFTYKSSLLITAAFCLTIFGIFLYHLITTQKNRNVFRKINFQGNEIEIFADCEESYFDKYLNEVLYLFENTNVNVIVFEDIDRFNTNIIFERLREINTLVNNQLKKDNKPPLRFFYLLRDDIFISKERTKFFDYIIPIVPVVDSSNSYDQFVSHLEANNILEKFDNDFLLGLSLYIDDMRILKNICNEFLIYYNRLNTIEPDYNKMLAIITYKNIFPRDFSDLQLNKGMVFTLFNKKNDFLAQEIADLKTKETQLKERIDLAHNEHAQSIEEIEVIKNHIEIKKLDDKFKSNHNYNYRNLPDYQKSLTELNDKINNRKDAVNIKQENKFPILEVELKNIQKEIKRTQSKYLSEILIKENIDEIFKAITYTNEIEETITFNEIKGNEYFNLLKYLIRNGYIDETYSDYMTYFYGNSLTQTDKIFLRSITDKKAKDYTYQLKNIPLIINRLRNLDFEQEEILNFDLFQFLLTHKIEYKSYLDLFFDYLKNNQDFKFIAAYFETERELSTYIEQLNIYWPQTFYYMHTKQALSEQQVKLFSIYTLYYSTNIESVNIEQCLSDYISNNPSYLQIIEPNINKLIDGFRCLNISFVAINYETADKKLFKAIYQYNLYELNLNNLVLMLEKIYRCHNQYDINHKNYTIIMSQSDSALAKYVNSHISEYLNIIFSICSNEINDEESEIISILNNESVSTEQKNNYISLLKTPIESIDAIKDIELWCSLLEKQIVFYSEKNILIYFKQHNNTLDIPLTIFINKGEQKLDFSEYDHDLRNKFFDEVIKCEALFNDKYKEIVSTLGFIYESSFEIDSIPEEKFKILVDLKIISMSQNNLNFIREKYIKPLIYYYIKNNLTKYKEIITQETAKLDEILEILSWGEISSKIKIELLRFTESSISILEKGYPKEIIEHILINNFDEKDLLVLTSSYKEWEQLIQKLILKHTIFNINILLLQPHNISTELLYDLLGSNPQDLNTDIKINLLIAKLKDLDKDICNKCLHLMQLPEYCKLFGRGNPKITVSDQNKMLLEALKTAKFINDYQISTNSPEYFDIKKSKKTDEDKEMID